jgi:hypothetical protein
MSAFASNEAKLRKAKGRRPSLAGPSGAQQRSCVRASGHINGGAERDRTADPLLAKQVLSQLSYSPNLLGTEPADISIKTGSAQSPFINTIIARSYRLCSATSTAFTKVNGGPG